MRIQKVKFHYQGGENEVIVKLPLLGIFHSLTQPYVKDVLGCFWLF